MTDPEVGRTALRHVLGRDPSPGELAQALAGYMEHLTAAVRASEGYTVMLGVVELLHQLIDHGCLLGLVTGNVEAAAHIKLARGHLNRFFSFGGYGSDSNDRTEVTRRSLERGRCVSGDLLDPSDCVGVGDTPRDVAAAHGPGSGRSPWRPATTAPPSSRRRGPTSCSPRCATGPRRWDERVRCLTCPPPNPPTRWWCSG